jgi:hypothetical protein
LLKIEIILALSFMKKNNQISNIKYKINPALQGKKYELTAESKAYIEESQRLLREKFKGFEVV